LFYILAEFSNARWIDRQGTKSIRAKEVRRKKHLSLSIPPYYPYYSRREVLVILL
jgi:hypothetical protein